MAFKNMRNLFTYGGTSPDKLVKKLVDGCDAGATWDDVVGEVALNVGPLSGQHLRGMEAHKDTLVLFTREFRVHRIVMSESMVLRSVHLFVPPPPDLPSRTLSTICLDQVDLTDHTLALVVPYLAKLRNLRKLSLCTNGLTLLEPLSPLLLGEGEDFPAVLETLLLSGNAFGKHGGSDVPSFFECFRQNGALTTLDLAGNDVPLEALQTLSGILFEENDVLRTVVLKNNPQIPKEDAEAIQLQAEKNEEMLAERVRREAATGAPTPRTAEPVAVSSVTESDSSKISRLTEEVTQLRKLVAAETVQNRQLEEDIAVSTETFMAKIATITAKSEAQIDALRKYGQTQATHGSFNTPLSSQAQPPLSDSFSPYTLGTTPNLSQNSHPDDRGHSPSHSDDGFPEPAGGELGDIVEKKRKAKKPKAKRKDPNQELEEKEREAKVAALETELEEVKTASEILSAEAKAANERIQSTEEEVAGLKEDLILAASERVGVDENAALVSAELATLKASHAVLQNAHDSASEATTTAQKTVQELTAKLSAAGVLQGAAEERCTNLSRTAEQLRTEAASTALSLETMTAEKTKQTEIIASLKQTMHESATATKYNQDEVNTLREAKEKNEKEVARLSVLLATLQQTSSVQEDSGKVEVGRLVEHNTTLQNKIDELETTLRLQTTTASTSAADADARFEAKTELLTQTVSDVTTQNGILQAEASVLREQAETHRSEMQTLRSELATVNTSLSPLQAEVESLKTETVELKEQKASLETVSKDAAAATQEIAKLATELEAKTTELAEVAEKLVEVEAVCSGHGQVVERLTKEKEELEAAVAQHLEHIAALEGAGVDAEEERARLVKHVDELHEGVKKRDVELEGVKELHEKEIKSAQAAHEGVLAQQEGASAEVLEELKASTDAAIKVLEASVEELTTEKDVLEMQKAKAARESQAKIEKLDRLSKDTAAKLTEARAQGKETSEHLEQAQEQIERYKRSEEQSAEELDELRAARLRRDEEITQLTANLLAQDLRHKEKSDLAAQELEAMQGRMNTEDAMRRAELQEKMFEDDIGNLSDESGDDPPEEGYSRDNWVSSKGVRACLRCENKFNFRNRKHHCRRCGQVFCGKCCSVSPLTDNKRVCIECNQTRK